MAIIIIALIVSLISVLLYFNRGEYEIEFSKTMTTTCIIIRVYSSIGVFVTSSLLSNLKVKYTIAKTCKQCLYIQHKNNNYTFTNMI